jgi:23S rRNA pseudouridine2605 synthase
MRIQRALARAGVASRRHSEELIAAGRVTINGRVAEIGQSVVPATDEIRVDGKTVQAPVEAEWIVLHKPAGVMTTRSDPERRKTVFDLVKPVRGLTYVGRLDYMTEGVLLLTTDGKAAHALTHPSGGVERTYVAIVTGDIVTAVKQARRGVELPDGPVTASDVSSKPISGGRHEFQVTITEGRKREVRRLCTALGLEVERLIRTQYGPVSLGKLSVGRSRGLTDFERTELERLTSAGSRMQDLGSRKESRT